MRVMRHWNRLPRKVMFEVRLHRALNNKIYWKMFMPIEAGWTKGSSKVPSDPNHSMILWSFSCFKQKHSPPTPVEPSAPRECLLSFWLSCQTHTEKQHCCLRFSIPDLRLRLGLHLDVWDGWEIFSCVPNHIKPVFFSMASNSRNE